MLPRVPIGVLSAGLFVVGCSSVSSSSRAASTAVTQAGAIQVTMTASGCRPAQLHAAPGDVRLAVRNEASATGSFVVLQGDRALGRLDGLPHGATDTLTLQLVEGAYRTTCQAGSAVGGAALLVGRAAGAPTLGQAADLLAATGTYRSWLRGQIRDLQSAVASLRDSLAAGDVASARSRFLAARLVYSRIKVAGRDFDTAQLPGSVDLDEAIDPRPAGATHGLGRIAAGLWSGSPTTTLVATATRLAGDVDALADRVGRLHVDAVSVMEAQTALLGTLVPDELSGRAEPDSHLDLVDAQGVLEGSQAALDAFERPLRARAAGVEGVVAARLTHLEQLLAAVRSPSGYPSTAALPASQRRALADAADAAADAYAQVAPALARPMAR
jgi:iron uptake system component EfeO